MLDRAGRPDIHGGNPSAGENGIGSLRVGSFDILRRLGRLRTELLFLRSCLCRIDRGARSAGGKGE